MGKRDVKLDQKVQDGLEQYGIIHSVIACNPGRVDTAEFVKHYH